LMMDTSARLRPRIAAPGKPFIHVAISYCAGNAVGRHGAASTAWRFAE
jgi:hypothetical protein